MGGARDCRGVVAGLLPMRRLRRQATGRPRFCRDAGDSSFRMIGCRSRTYKRPGSPIVLRKRVTTEHFARLTIIILQGRLILLTAAPSSVRDAGSSAQ